MFARSVPMGQAKDAADIQVAHMNSPLDTEIGADPSTPLPPLFSVQQVTAASLDPRSTPVSAIMTKNPMVTRDTTSATEALELMVQRGFRHLVC